MPTDWIRAEAQALRVEAITRIDRFVCDVKDSQFGDGLHVWGRAPEAGGGAFDTSASVAAERQALLDVLDGRRIAPGPSDSPWRGRTDVLPTGRNLYTTDPRSVPTRAVYRQGEALADELIRRHLQDEGDWPRGLVVDLWGSATMRTAGEEGGPPIRIVSPLYSSRVQSRMSEIRSKVPAAPSSSCLASASAFASASRSFRCR